MSFIAQTSYTPYLTTPVKCNLIIPLKKLKNCSFLRKTNCLFNVFEGPGLISTTRLKNFSTLAPTPTPDQKNSTLTPTPG